MLLNKRRNSFTVQSTFNDTEDKSNEVDLNESRSENDEGEQIQLIRQISIFIYYLILIPIIETKSLNEERHHVLDLNMEETKDISNPKQEKEQKQSIEKELKAKEKYFG